MREKSRTEELLPRATGVCPTRNGHIRGLLNDGTLANRRYECRSPLRRPFAKCPDLSPESESRSVGCGTFSRDDRSNGFAAKSRDVSQLADRRAGPVSDPDHVVADACFFRCPCCAEATTASAAPTSPSIPPRYLSKVALASRTGCGTDLRSPSSPLTAAHSWPELGRAAPTIGPIRPDRLTGLASIAPASSS